MIFMPPTSKKSPNFEEVEGSYWFGSVRAVSQSVCLSVSQSVRLSLWCVSTRSGTIRARICESYFPF